MKPFSRHLLTNPQLSPKCVWDGVAFLLNLFIILSHEWKVRLNWIELLIRMKQWQRRCRPSIALRLLEIRSEYDELTWKDIKRRFCDAIKIWSPATYTWSIGKITQKLHTEIMLYYGEHSTHKSYGASYVCSRFSELSQALPSAKGIIIQISCQTITSWFVCYILIRFVKGTLKQLTELRQVPFFAVKLLLPATNLFMEINLPRKNKMNKLWVPLTERGGRGKCFRGGTFYYLFTAETERVADV